MSLISRSCDSSTQPPPHPLPCNSSNDKQTSHQQQLDDQQVNQVLNNSHAYNTGSLEHPLYHIVPSSASSASSSAISSYTLPPHMQYYHSHHYLTTSSSSPPSATVEYSNYNNDTQGDLGSVPEPR